ncbi:MAG: hypothetical protein A2Y17_12480 [Clostridiales bacterium GWF2_38_85]|nr:MAG: hypothetical protein A2Y17_12480 [Clostridiales bacterium GWF2_38_85]HBL84074.1 tRNA threonylcarbamoyladenosine dehydratase [Clostridiales bacterium]
MEWYNRTEHLLGSSAIEILKKSSVAICGLGGVGSYVTEALCRVGIGKFYLIDNDIYDKTNLNRQLHATTDTIGMTKVQVVKERILKINPGAIVETYEIFLNKDNIPVVFEQIINQGLDFIVDAIDNITAKVELAIFAEDQQLKIISSMGTANKLDPTKFKIADIYETGVCPLAKVMRKLLKEKAVKHLMVVYSIELPIKSEKLGSVSYVPSTAGLYISYHVTSELLKNIYKKGE